MQPFLSFLVSFLISLMETQNNYEKHTIIDAVTPNLSGTIQPTKPNAKS